MRPAAAAARSRSPDCRRRRGRDRRSLTPRSRAGMPAEAVTWTAIEQRRRRSDRGVVSRRRSRPRQGLARHQDGHGRGPHHGGVLLMLLHLLPSLDSPDIALWRFITFRTAAASITALVISLLLGPVADSPAPRVPDRSGHSAGRSAEPSRQGRHADDGRTADSGRRARADAAVGGPDQRLRLDCGARHRMLSARSDFSTTT